MDRTEAPIAKCCRHAKAAEHRFGFVEQRASFGQCGKLLLRYCARGQGRGRSGRIVARNLLPYQCVRPKRAPGRAPP
jgi:hypothetical protein